MLNVLTAIVLLAAGCAANSLYSTPDADDAGEEDAGELDADDVDADDADAGDVDAQPCLSREICVNGVDDDCDGFVDDGCDDLPCEPWTRRECTWLECDPADAGCHMVQTCLGDGRWSTCHGCPVEVEFPTDELCCDGLDNDCDGSVDEDCHCDDCGLCAPGAWRYCDDPNYDLPGAIQMCDEDGESWGPCYESDYGPAECIEQGLTWFSPEYQYCLISLGACTQDFWDVDGDLDTWESVGCCPEVLCEPPAEEICGDWFDNDWDGHVDEDCGECSCFPISWRWCDDPAYSNWGRQQCGLDGEWERCDETSIPEACGAFAWYSPDAEACLIEAGECGQDMWDLDLDGDTWESLGDCPEPVCPD